MKREYRDYVRDILEAINKAEEFVSGMKFQDFEKDDKTLFAVIRALGIIGEAVKNIPDSLRVPYKSIPWKEISGMRDKLVHEYFGVNEKVVWNTVKEDLPLLKKVVIKVLADLEKSSSSES